MHKAPCRLTFSIPPRSGAGLPGCPLNQRRSARNRSSSLSFPAQADPPGRLIILHCVHSERACKSFGRSEDMYPHGDLFVNEVPAQADLAFRTTYDLWLNHFLEDLQAGQAICLAGYSPWGCCSWCPVGCFSTLPDSFIKSTWAKKLPCPPAPAWRSSPWSCSGQRRSSFPGALPPSGLPLDCCSPSWW